MSRKTDVYTSHGYVQTVAAIGENGLGGCDVTKETYVSITNYQEILDIRGVRTSPAFNLCFYLQT